MKQKKTILGFAMIIHSLYSYAQQPDQEYNHCTLKTRWHSNMEVTPYPRPQLKRDNWINLNGQWEFAITDSADSKPIEYSGKINVPFPIESKLSGVSKKLNPNQSLWYKRYFNIPHQNGKYLLNFGAVDYEATVYLNGKEIGKHKGGYLPFTIDITNFIKNTNNELVVKVYDPTDTGPNPHGKQTLTPSNIYYTPSSGIWQTVWIENVPQSFISSIKTNPNIDNNTINLNINLNSDYKNKKLELTIYIINDGKIINSKSVLVSKGSNQSILSLSIPDAKLWSPEFPFIYDLKVILSENKKKIDEIDSYFGMRKITIQKDEKGMDRIFLNNKYTYNLGILDQGFWPDGLYTAPSDEALEYDIKAIKLMGFNTIRKHIKIEPERWYYYADKLGILVWQDFVNPPQQLPIGSKVEFENEIQETIEQLYNHPSIVLWTLFNEGWGAYDQERLTKFVKKIDSTRLINGHSGEMLYSDNLLRSQPHKPWMNSDIVDIHTYPFPRNTPNLPGKAKVIGEFGGIGVSTYGHQWNDMQGWGYVQANATELKEKYRQMTDSLKILETNGLSASIYTQPFDVEDEENGLISYDREIIKIPIDTLRALNKKLNPFAENTIYSNFHVAQDIDVNDNDNRFNELLAKYNNGNRDSALLRRLVLIATRQKKQDIVSKIGNDYIEILNDPYSFDNLRLIKYITKSPSDKGFRMFLEKSNQIDKILGNYTSSDVLKPIIKKFELPAFKFEPDKNYDWDKILKDVTNKYGEIGEEAALGRIMIEYSGLLQNKPDWEKFGKYYVLYFKKALKHPEYIINMLSWPIFKHINDPETLRFAATVVKYAIDNWDNSPNTIDTYANLLHKTQQTQKAIEWESKALEQIRGTKDEQTYAETLQKMKDNKPTWPQN
ncbi:glycoside hydrolase family 2 [Chitinophaga silvatica]|uniref:Glycoside hydrolase family 2 n=1 Tax=Chitinophaga silvatica TaxID=2282649 RepID=A0A3E1Y727_9BACT|nr:sugar-binding domain-containing protein [Chitinophaga silvatica]RFS20742.1 glycoside hydrolase family 2 [Chitinophaga silvatica]